MDANWILGTKYCGPFNRMDKGDPVNGVDAACYEHDVEYGKDPSWWKYTPFYNSQIVRDADQKLIDKIDEMEEKGIEIGPAGRIGRMFFKAKKRVVDWGDPGPDRALPLGPRLQSLHGPNPLLNIEMARASRAYVPKVNHGFGYKGRNYTIGFKSFFKYMRYRKRRFRRKLRKYKKRRLNKARKYLRSRKFRKASSAFRKAFMKGKKRHVKKGIRVSRNINRALKFESYVSAPKKYDGTCCTAFDMNTASGSPNLNTKVLGIGASSTGNYNPEFWIQPGWSGGSAASTIPFQGSPLATWNTGAELNSIISAVGYTASSAVNRTFFYNWLTTHELVNCSNYPVRMKVYRCTPIDNIPNIGSPATDIAFANRGSGNYRYPFNLMQQYASNTTLFPNAATAQSFGYAFSDGVNFDSTVFASEKNFNPQHCTDLNECYKVRKVADFTLHSMKKVILREKHRPMEYNSRCWINSCKKHVSWCYLVSFSADTYKTSAGLFRQPWPTITVDTHIRCNVQQTTLRDYVAKYVVRSSAYVGTLATCQVNQEGEADVIAD